MLSTTKNRGFTSTMQMRMASSMQGAGFGCFFPDSPETNQKYIVECHCCKKQRCTLRKQASVDRFSSQLKSGVSAPKSTLEDKTFYGSFASL